MLNLDPHLRALPEPVEEGGHEGGAQSTGQGAEHSHGEAKPGNDQPPSRLDGLQQPLLLTQRQQGFVHAECESKLALPVEEGACQPRRQRAQKAADEETYHEADHGAGRQGEAQGDAAEADATHVGRGRRWAPVRIASAPPTMRKGRPRP